MLLVTQTHVLAKRYGLEKAIEMLANAGFDGLDLSMFDMTYDPDSLINSPDRFKKLAEIQKLADSCGIKFRQAHAPFVFTDRTEEGFREVTVPILKRSIETAGFLGVKAIVVHPIWTVPHMYNVEKNFETNMEFYNGLKETALKSGTKIALENMFELDRRRRNIIVDAVCETVEEINRYLDALGNEAFTFCLDVGHCAVCGREPQDVIRALGKRIGALHVQDNNYVEDLHTLPYISKINWKEVTLALGQSGYEGDLTFEADNFVNRFDDGMTPYAVDFMAKVGKDLVAKVEAARNAQ